jgi:phosphohistidine phosphatase
MNKPNNCTNMKTLYLVRHAEAAPGRLLLPDHDRPLTERGRREAATMGQRVAQRITPHGAPPDVLLASSATRARSTAELLAQALGIARERIVVNERLYNATADELLGEIAQLDAQPQSVMVVAHNPGLTDLAHHFASDITHLPTCAVVEVALAVQAWGEIGEAPVAAVRLDVPANNPL